MDTKVTIPFDLTADKQKRQTCPRPVPEVCDELWTSNLPRFTRVRAFSGLASYLLTVFFFYFIRFTSNQEYIRNLLSLYHTRGKMPSNLLKKKHSSLLKHVDLRVKSADTNP